jgi:hypothetical protein
LEGRSLPPSGGRDDLSMQFKRKDRAQALQPVGRQVKAWHKASRKMGWGIRRDSFANIGTPPPLTERERAEGFIGSGLFYGFGDDGNGNADAVLSGRLVWEYALRLWRIKTWQCEYIDFNTSDRIRLRAGAPARPKGFYFAKFQPGMKYQTWTVSRLRRRLSDDETGCAPEGIQLLAITNTHLRNLMAEKRIPFMALADYDVAPYGFNDFFDAAQIFFNQDVLGLGIGNLDRNYPRFGIPTLRFDAPS